MAFDRKNRPTTPTTTRTTPTTPTTPSTPTPAAAPAQRSEVKGSGTAPRIGTPRVLTHDMIAKRAYEIYASRGFTAGNQDDDWREAERQLRAGL